MKISSMMKCSFEEYPRLLETHLTALKESLSTIGFPFKDCEKILKASLVAYALASLQSALLCKTLPMWATAIFTVGSMSTLKSSISDGGGFHADLPLKVLFRDMLLNS